MCIGNFDLFSHLFGDPWLSWLIFYLFLCVSIALQCGKPVSGCIVLGAFGETVDHGRRM